jgi:hypothetical protein
MTTWYDAQSTIVEAANLAMGQIAVDGSLDSAEREARIRAVWEPVANALLNARPDLADWPELAQQAEEAGPDYIGVTSDTRQVVVWGAEHPGWRDIVLLDRPAA